MTVSRSAGVMPTEHGSETPCAWSAFATSTRYAWHSAKAG
jgi:hypothetical protein